MTLRHVPSRPSASFRVSFMCHPRLASDVDLGTSRLVVSIAEKQVVLPFLPVLDGSAALVFLNRFKTFAASVQDVRGHLRLHCEMSPGDAGAGHQQPSGEAVAALTARPARRDRVTVALCAFSIRHD